MARENQTFCRIIVSIRNIPYNRRLKPMQKASNKPENNTRFDLITPNNKVI